MGFNFIVNWHQTIFSSYHCTNHLLGGAVYCPLLLGQGSVGRPAPKAPSRNQLMSCCKKCSWATWPQKTRFINKDKRAKISRLVIDVIFRLLAVRCLWLERSIVKIPFRKNHIKCPCENPIVCDPMFCIRRCFFLKTAFKGIIMLHNFAICWICPKLRVQESGKDRKPVCVNIGGQCTCVT